MSEAIESLLRNAEQRRFTRREMMLALGAAAIAPRVMAQGAPTPISFRRLNSATMYVSDVQRSVDFYQKIFGMPIQAKQGQTVVLRIGDGPQFLAIAPANGGPIGIYRFGLAVDDYNPQRLKAKLDAFGVKDARIVMRGPDQGGAPQGTPEVFFTDATGYEVQLQAPTYGGGGGANGDVLLPVSKPATAPPIQLVGYSHMTFGGDRAFYERVFKMPTQAMQGALAMLKVGDTLAFLTGGSGGPNAFGGGGAAAGRGAPPAGGAPGGGAPGGAPGGGAPGAAPAAGGAARPAGGRSRVGHICVTMQGYDPNQITGILMQLGIEPIEHPAPANMPRPLTIRTRLRQRAGNGGGPTHPLGSYETYLRDPDDIETQIQDVSYCGGSGANGQICP